ncbi:hypothetical protein QQS21_005202 [Conoideocrella luteorostrata]|uniref:Something about silencing protein 4 domain-containing protein n=1 Tax=Conoideocrella luteorostrata TaxID=1105319 RepID=A0AAJ0CU38_9HYPO|nr:hypothetical protein QQS21_005202 [Conoideocrella luteorostrata]
MASVTRSNRRAESLHHAHHPHRAHHHLNAHAHNHHPLTRAANPPVGLFASNDGGGGGRGRQKRPLEPADRDINDLKPKRTRIAVEIVARQAPPPVQGVRPSIQPAPPIPRPPTVVPAPTPPPSLLQPPLPLPNNTTSKVISTTSVAPPSLPSRPISQVIPPPVATAAGASQHPAPSAQPTNASKSKSAPDGESLTKHQAKVINGIKAELDRLQPQPMTAREQGRKLRSQEATRYKSDLSAYFPDYDEVVGNDPKEEHLLNLETPIVVVDTHARRAVLDAQRGGSRAHQQNYMTQHFPVRGYGDSLYTDVFESQRIDFGFLETQQTNKRLDDPLPDALFEPSHKRAERLERSIRNTEKGRAQHEKDQIIRLLEGLQGHDWLRVMGVSGITETKKKSFEPAREYFIKGCQGILEKFRTWNLEEKRRKQEKDRALQAEQEAVLAQQQQQEQQEQQETQQQSENEDSVEDDGAEGNEVDQDGSDMDQDGAEIVEDLEEVVTSQSDTSDASPAKQLRQEALARSQLAVVNSKKAKAPVSSAPAQPPQPQKEFTSFFSKKYERDTALNRTRRTGRKVLAWGHPIPEVEEADFVLPERFRDEDMLKSRARKKRRDKRHSRS